MRSNGGIQLRVGDFVYAILKRWKLILALTFIGLLFGIMLSAVSYMQGSYTSFEITSSFAIVAQSESGIYSGTGGEIPNSSDFHLSEDMVSAAKYIIKSDLTMNAAIEEMQMVGVTPRDITSNLSVSQYSDTQIIELTLNWRDAEEGTAILGAVMSAAQASLREVLRIGTVVVINQPTSRNTMSGSLSSTSWGIVAVLGFLAGVGFAVMELLMRPTLTNIRDVEGVLGLETLGIIPKNDKYFRQKRSILSENENEPSAVGESYAAAAYILRNRLGSADGPKCFYVTATIAGEGKTTVAANLAIQLSDMEKRVLLIDLDLRNPGLGRLFLDQVDYHHSLNALYRGEATQSDAVTTLTGYLDILPSVLERHAITMDGTITELIKDLSLSYDYVVMDAPPVGQESQTLSLNQLAESVLYVVRYDNASLPDIRSSLERLDKSGIRVLGCIVNAAQNVSGIARSSGLIRQTELRRRYAEPEQLIWEKDPDLAPISTVKAPQGTQGKRQRGKKEKKNDRPRRKRGGKRKKDPNGQEQAQEQQPETSDEQAPPVRNLLDDLFGDDSVPRNTVMSDREAADALYKLGVEGGFAEDGAGEEETVQTADEEETVHTADG